MSATQAGCWIALDPGRHKCGLVRSDSKGERIMDLLICSPRECWDWLQHWLEPGGVQGLVLGDGTSSSAWQDCIQELDPHLQLLLQPEYASTLEARERYWQLYPPRGWRRLLPAGLRLPPRPVDDLAALVLLERYLGRCLQAMA